MIIDMEYYVFIQNSESKEKLVASSPSIEVARKMAQEIANTNRIKGVAAALLCVQKEKGGEIKELELYHRGNAEPEIPENK